MYKISKEFDLARDVFWKLKSFYSLTTHLDIRSTHRLRQIGTVDICFGAHNSMYQVGHTYGLILSKSISLLQQMPYCTRKGRGTLTSFNSKT